MRPKLEKYVISPSASILDALRKIDQNQKGFLVIVDDANVAVGTLTDGDIRRAFIAGKSVQDGIAEIYRKAFSFLRTSDKVSDAIEVFKNRAIKFLPVLDDNMALRNIITKNQLHALLLQDIRATLEYDFSKLDEQIVDYEIYRRPWGFYKTTVYNEYFQSKIISVYPGGQLSLQSHRHREEYWIVVHGAGTAQIGESIISVRCGSSLFIPKGCKHRLINTDRKESLIITEVQLGDYLGEDDIIRYEDLYGRITIQK